MISALKTSAVLKIAFLLEILAGIIAIFGGAYVTAVLCVVAAALLLTSALNFQNKENAAQSGGASDGSGAQADGSSEESDAQADDTSEITETQADDTSENSDRPADGGETSNR